MEIGKSVIDMLDRFGASSNFETAKSSAIVCVDSILETIFEYGALLKGKKAETEIIFWNRVKLDIWRMKAEDYMRRIVY